MSQYEAKAGQVLVTYPRQHNDDYIHDCKAKNCPTESEPDVVADFIPNPGESEFQAMRRGFTEAIAVLFNILDAK